MQNFSLSFDLIRMWSSHWGKFLIQLFFLVPSILFQNWIVTVIKRISSLELSDIFMVLINHRLDNAPKFKYKLFIEYKKISIKFSIYKHANYLTLFDCIIQLCRNSKRRSGKWNAINL